MKYRFIFKFILTLLALPAFSAEISCSHYYHVYVHGTEANIIKWQQIINFELGANEKALKDLLTKNQSKSSAILEMLQKNKKVLAKLEMEQILGRKLNEADDIRDLAFKFARSALFEKILIQERHDEYSDIELKLSSKLELTETEEWLTTEALIVNVKNNVSKVQSSYYHSLNNYALIAQGFSPKTLNEYRLNLALFKIKDTQFGDIQGVSYKCTYPNKAMTSNEQEEQYVKFITKAQNYLQELRTRSKLQNNNVKINETEETPSTLVRPGLIFK